MKIPFSKSHGAGNDFALFDLRFHPQMDLGSLAPQLCDRHFGIGADGLIGLSAASDEVKEKADFKMHYFNADGSRSVCANGIRCLVSFIDHLGDFSKANRSINIETDDGVKSVFRSSRPNYFRVEMGRAYFDAKDIPTRGKGEQLGVVIDLEDRTLEVYAVGMGNPHCVIFVEDLNEAEVEKLGPELEHHAWFPERTNVEFVQRISDESLKIRIWERGVGETLACGTGNCAVFALCYKLGFLKSRAEIASPGGKFIMEMNEDSEIAMTGPAEIVFSGEIQI